MKYLALATDYDGTIARHGVVDDTTMTALAKFRASGRKLILVTGRELPELRGIFPGLKIFDLVVAENGALLHHPDTEKDKVLAASPPEKFPELLRERGVKALSVGKVIVATHAPYESLVLQAIRDLGLELQVIFNKGDVMILPSGVNKATGLTVALNELGLNAQNVIGVGDAENDHSFLQICGLSVAVGNAIDSLKEVANVTTLATHGAGVTELIEEILRSDS